MTTTHALTVFAADTAVLTVTDKKGNERAYTPEGAMFKGGKELTTQMKDAAVMSAISKAANGRFRAAADILEVAFPKAAKAAAAVNGASTAAWANKETMRTLVQAAENTARPEKGWSAKQEQARFLILALRSMPAFKVETEQREVIENAA